MTEHLTPEQIGRLSNYELTGDALVAALTHIEECEQCRLEVRSPSKAEVVSQLFRDEREVTEKDEEMDDLKP